MNKFGHFLLCLACFGLCAQVQAFTVRGTGNGALIGNDITDLGNDGIEGNYNPPGDFGGFDAEFSVINETPGFGGGEFAFNVFDNVTGGGNNKVCCGSGSFPVSIDARILAGPHKLTGFTLTSSNDSPGRDPRHWAVQGSTDGVNFTTIFELDTTGSGASVWGNDRNEVIEFSVALGDFPVQTEAYNHFRFITFVTGGAYALGEIEYFGDLFLNTPPEINNLDGDVLLYPPAPGTGPLPIDQGTAASAVDLDAGDPALDLTAGSLSVSITSGAAVGDDQLGIRDQGTGAGQIGFASPPVVTFENTAIGSAAGGRVLPEPGGFSFIRATEPGNDTDLDLALDYSFINIDGLAVSAGDIIIVKDQVTNPEENGLYVVDASFFLSRDPFMDDASEVLGTTAVVGDGTVNTAGTSFFVSAFGGTQTLDTDAIAWSPGSAPITDSMVIGFNANATPAAVSALLQNITYDNANAATPANPRQVEFVLTDGAGDSATANTIVLMDVGGTSDPHIWEGDVSDEWNTGGNWDSGTVPDSNDIAIFRDQGVATGNVDLGGGAIVGTVSFDGTGSFDLNAGPLSVISINHSGTGDNQISSAISAIGFSGTVTGGSLTLTAANSTDGDWTVNAPGELASGGGGLGDGNVTLDGGQLTVLPNSASVMGRFVQVMNNGTAGRRMDIGEIEVFAPGVVPTVNNAGGQGALNPSTDLAQGPTAVVHSKTTNQPHGGDDDGRLIDAAETTGGGTWSSNGAGNFVIIDLGSTQAIGSARVHQRNDGCCQDRLRDFTVSIFDDNGGNPGAEVASSSFPAQPPNNGFGEVAFLLPVDFSANSIEVLADSVIEITAGAGDATFADLDFVNAAELSVDSVDGTTLTFAGATTLDGTATLTQTGMPTINLSSVSGIGGLVQNGDGIVNLLTANTYDGPTTVAGGVLVAGSNLSLGNAATGTAVENGGGLQVSGGTFTEPLSLNGTGNAKIDGALNKKPGANLIWDAPITITGTSRIFSEGNELFIDAGLNLGANELTLDAQNRINIRGPGMSGTGRLRLEGNDRTDFEVTSNGFTGPVDIFGDGRADVHQNNGLGNGGLVRVQGGNATLLIRNGRTLVNDVEIGGDGRGTEGAIRNEDNTNTIDGTVTLTAASMIHVNNTSLTITGGVQGSSTLAKNGAGTLILPAAGSISGFALNAGSVRIGTATSLGSTSQLLVPAGGSLEFDGTMTFDGATALNSIALQGTLNALSGITVLDDVVIDVPVDGGISVGGEGDLVINQPIGNGDVAVAPGGALDHFGYHINNDGLALNLDVGNNHGMLNGGGGLTAPRIFDPQGARVIGTTAEIVAIDFADPNGMVIDGETLQQGDIVLVKDQSVPSENGLYVADLANFFFTRDAFMDEGSELPGVEATITAGATQAGQVFHTDFSNGTTLGASDVNWISGNLVGGGLNFDPFTFSSFEGAGLLTNGPGNRGMDFNNDADWRAVPAVTQDDGSGDGFVIDRNDNYSNLLVGNLCVSPGNAGDWEFRRVADDDNMSIWLDLNQNGIFELSNNERIQNNNDGGVKTHTLAAGEYLFAATHREGGGGSQLHVEFKTPNMGSRVNIKPGDFAQAGIWKPLFGSVPPVLPSNSLTKFGDGTAVLAGDNTFNGDVTVLAGALVAAHENALGSSGNVEVQDSGSLGLDGDIDVTLLDLVLDGPGGAGAPGALFNLSGNNSLTIPQITAATVSLGEVRVGAVAGSLVVNGDFDLQLSKLSADGAGAVEITGDISGATPPPPPPPVARFVQVINNGAANRRLHIGELEVFSPSGSADNDNAGGNNAPLNNADDLATAAMGASVFSSTPVSPGGHGNPNQVIDGQEETGGTTWTSRNTTSGNEITIDLGADREIGSIRLHQRNDGCCQGRLSNYTVNLLADGGGTPGAVVASLVEPGQPPTNRFGEQIFGVLPNNQLMKMGTGTLTLSGDNSYDAGNTILGGTLIAASNTALGTGGTTLVENGGTLGLSGGILVDGEDFTLSGLGAAGRPGVLVGINGLNTIGAGSTITAGATTELGIGAEADTLVVTPDIDLRSAKLAVGGAGDSVLEGVIGSSGGVSGPSMARFVQVQKNDGNLLHIGEMEVFVPGTGATVNDVNGNNTPFNNTDDIARLSQGASVVTATGVNGHGVPNSVIDGLNQTAGNVWTKQQGPGAEITIDLGGTFPIDTIRLHQRDDGCCQDRLSNYTVRFFADDGGAVGPLVQEIVQPGQAPTNLFDEFIVPPSTIPQDNNLMKMGSGLLTVSGANTFPDGTTVLDGVLRVNNIAGSGTGPGPVLVENGGAVGGNGSIDGLVTLNAGGTLAPGSNLGDLTVQGGITFADPTSSFLVELFGATTPGADFDRVDSLGALNLTGDLVLQRDPGYTPVDGDTLVIATGVPQAGTFVNAPSEGDTVTDDGGVDWEVSYLSNQVELTALPPPALADDNILRTRNNNFVTIPNAFLLGNDLPGQGGTLDLTAANADGSPTRGTVTLFGSRVYYQPPADDFAPDQFEVTVTETPSGLTATSTVFIDVVPDLSFQEADSIVADGGGPGINRVSFTGVPGVTYCVQFSADMIVWTDIQSVQANALNGRYSVDHDPGAVNPGFYRSVFKPVP